MMFFILQRVGGFIKFCSSKSTEEECMKYIQEITDTKFEGEFIIAKQYRKVIITHEVTIRPQPIES